MLWLLLPRATLLWMMMMILPRQKQDLQRHQFRRSLAEPMFHLRQPWSFGAAAVVVSVAGVAAGVGEAVVEGCCHLLACWSLAPQGQGSHLLLQPVNRRLERRYQLRPRRRRPCLLLFRRMFQSLVYAEVVVQGCMACAVQCTGFPEFRRSVAHLHLWQLVAWALGWQAWAAGRMLTLASRGDALIG